MSNPATLTRDTVQWQCSLGKPALSLCLCLTLPLSPWPSVLLSQYQGQGLWQDPAPPISKAGWAGGARGVPVPARSSETKGFSIVGLWMVTGSGPARAAGWRVSRGRTRPAPLPLPPWSRSLSENDSAWAAGGWPLPCAGPERIRASSCVGGGGPRAVPRTPRPRRYQRHHLHPRSSGRQPPTWNPAPRRPLRPHRCRRHRLPEPARPPQRVSRCGFPVRPLPAEAAPRPRLGRIAEPLSPDPPQRRCRRLRRRSAWFSREARDAAESLAAAATAAANPGKREDQQEEEASPSPPSQQRH